MICDVDCLQAKEHLQSKSWYFNKILGAGSPFTQTTRTKILWILKHKTIKFDAVGEVKPPAAEYIHIAEQDSSKENWSASP